MTRFKTGLRVMHHIQGLGTIKWAEGSVCRVRWDNGSTGIAYVSDCCVVAGKASSPRSES